MSGIEMNTNQETPKSIKETELIQLLTSPEGSLALLALGHVGIQHWREIRGKTGGKNPSVKTPTMP
ncbi:MAG: hypothetical protein ACK40M_09355 [Flavobacteriales bacterium]